jgi:hypothetical protein
MSGGGPGRDDVVIVGRHRRRVIRFAGFRGRIDAVPIQADVNVRRHDGDAANQHAPEKRISVRIRDAARLHGRAGKKFRRFWRAPAPGRGALRSPRMPGFPNMGPTPDTAPPPRWDRKFDPMAQGHREIEGHPDGMGVEPGWPWQPRTTFEVAAAERVVVSGVGRGDASTRGARCVRMVPRHRVSSYDHLAERPVPVSYQIGLVLLEGEQHLGRQGLLLDHVLGRHRS